MSSETLKPLPETSAETLRYESAIRAERNYRRLRLFRNAVVLSALGASTARAVFTLFLVPSSDPFLSTPVLFGVSLLASVFLALATMSARAHRDNCRITYEEFVARARPRIGAP